MDEHKRYVTAEVKRIQVDKYDEGLRRKKDPGQDYISRWVKKHGEKFRRRWKYCKCRYCVDAEECGWKQARQCDNFRELKD